MALDPSISSALDVLRNRRSAIDDAIKALEALDAGEQSTLLPARSEDLPAGGVAPERPPSTGGGAGGARSVLRAAPGRGFTAAHLAKAMLDNGWVTPSKNPRAAARAAANRLREDPDEHVFFENSQFFYRPPSQAPEGLEAGQEGAP